MSKMSKANYTAIAEILSHSEPVSQGNAAQATWSGLVEDMADYFADNNGLFDRQRFYKAAGYRV